MRKRYGDKLKAKAALEAIKNEITIAELATKYEVHRDLVQKWKKIILERSAGLFSLKEAKGGKSNEKKVDELYKQIGQLKVENDWLKKKL